MNVYLEEVSKIVKTAGFGNLSFNTMTVYQAYYMRYCYYRDVEKATKMEAYEWTAGNMGASVPTIIRAITIMQKIAKNIDKHK